MPELIRRRGLALCAVVLVSVGGCRPTPAPQAEDASRRTEVIVARPVVNEEATRTHAIRVFFEGGLIAEGQEPTGATEVTEQEGGWLAKVGNSAYPIHIGTPPFFDYEKPNQESSPTTVRVELAGWRGVDVTLPEPTAGGRIFIETRVLLKRETAIVAVAAPPGGVDYEYAELVWRRPLPGQPLATGLPNSPRIPLHVSGVTEFAPSPSGVYDLVLTSSATTHLRPFVLAKDLALQVDAREAGILRNRVFSLPSSLAGSYIGFADSWVDPDRAKAAMGAFLGVRLDWASKTGQMVVINTALKSNQALRFADLRPLPDCVWPVTNLQLIDPVTMEFDCPMAFADYHFTLSAADGVNTLKTEFEAPENEAFKRDLYSRMLHVFNTQRENAKRDPAAFDPSFGRLKTQDLHGFQVLASPQNFAEHLSKRAKKKIATIQMGRVVEVKLGDGQNIDVKVD